MKKKDLIQKTFKKSSKFLKLTTHQNSLLFISSKKNFKLKDRQISAAHKIIVRTSKNKRVKLLSFMKYWNTSRTLGSKMGSGKGKPKMQLVKIKKYQNLINLNSLTKNSKREKSLDQFLRF